MSCTRIDALIPGTEYWVDQHWNILNTVRYDTPSHFVGKFVKLKYINGQYHTHHNSGLITIREPGRTNVIFHDAYGNERVVSSMNKFYQRYRPALTDIHTKNNIISLRSHFPHELRRIISSFFAEFKTVTRIRHSCNTKK